MDLIFAYAKILSSIVVLGAIVYFFFLLLHRRIKRTNRKDVSILVATIIALFAVIASAASFVLPFLRDINISKWSKGGKG